jgi:microcompartment protein CcmL/EutN
VVTVNVEGTIAAVKNALLAQGLSLVTTEDGNQSVIPLIGN